MEDTSQAWMLENELFDNVFWNNIVTYSNIAEILFNFYRRFINPNPVIRNEALAFGIKSRAWFTENFEYYVYFWDAEVRFDDIAQILYEFYKNFVEVK